MQSVLVALSHKSVHRRHKLAAGAIISPQWAGLQEKVSSKISSKQSHSAENEPDPYIHTWLPISIHSIGICPNYTLF